MRRVLRLIAPSGPIVRDDFHQGVRFLREHFDVRYRDDIVERTGFLAGEDERRSSELQEALLDDDADAIVAVRGGHGAMRLLDGLDIELVRRSSKPVVGFSDITALHLAWARAGVPSLHASMVGALGRDAGIRSKWLDAIESIIRGESPKPCTGLQVWRAGEAQGRLLGGNLRVVTSLIGTVYAPNFDGAILLLEDVGERAYRVDRLLTSLHLHGVFARVAGVVLGDFHECHESDGVSCQSVLQAFFAESPFPVLAGLAVGHGARNVPVPLGVLTSIHPDGELRFRRSSDASA